MPLGTSCDGSRPRRDDPTGHRFRRVRGSVPPSVLIPYQEGTCLDDVLAEPEELAQRHVPSVGGPVDLDPVPGQTAQQEPEAEVGIGVPDGEFESGQHVPDRGVRPASEPVLRPCRSGAGLESGQEVGDIESRLEVLLEGPVVQGPGRSLPPDEGDRGGGVLASSPRACATTRPERL